MDETRTITMHHDGHGLNDDIVIVSDPLDPANGNGAHTYVARLDGNPVATIQFQHGPRHVKGSTPGITEAALLAILIDRINNWQAGPFACRENAICKTKLEECLHWTRARADERAKRGVLGTLTK